jgi:hypothetical protein
MFELIGALSLAVARALRVWRSYPGVVLAAAVCALFVLAGHADAAERPTPQTLTKWRMYLTSPAFDSGYLYDSWQDACTKAAQVDCETDVNAPTWGKCVRTSSNSCGFDMYDRNGAPGGSGNWRAVGYRGYSQGSQSQLTCPSGFTVSGAECVCAGGKVWDGQACVGSCITTGAVDAAAYAKTAGTSWLSGPDGTTCSASGCEWAWARKYQGYDGQWYGANPYPTGADCNRATPGAPPAEEDPSEDPTTPNTCPIGQCPGSVNGLSVCVPCQKSQETKAETKNSDGTSTETETSCSAGICTTTKINKTGGVETSRSTSTETQVDHCAKNPLSGNCAGITNDGTGGQNVGGNGSGGTGTCEGADCPPESTWGGNCAASFSCSGDAVQCAIAKDQHMRHCTLFEDENPLSVVGQGAMNGQAQPSGHPGAPGSTAGVSLDFQQVIDTTNPIGGSCPADVSIPYSGKVLVIPLASMCDEFMLLGQLFVGVSMLAAAFIVFKG